MTESGIYRNWFQSVLFGYKTEEEELTKAVDFKVGNFGGYIGPIIVSGYGFLLCVLFLIFERFFHFISRKKRVSPKPDRGRYRRQRFDRQSWQSKSYHFNSYYLELKIWEFSVQVNQFAS